MEFNKECTKCFISKPYPESFPKQSAKRGGYETRCKDCKCTYLKEYKITKEDKVKSNQSKYAWKKRNPEKAKASLNDWHRRKYKEDPLYRLVCLVRCRISEVTRTNRLKGHKSSMKYLGCTVEEFKTHLENQFQPGMTWDNNTHFGWHIDHIKPIASFDLSDPKQRDEAFHYTNLQPLWWKDNLRKGKKNA